MIEASAATVKTLADTLIDLYGLEALDIAKRQVLAGDGLEIIWSAVVANLMLPRSELEARVRLLV